MTPAITANTASVPSFALTPHRRFPLTTMLCKLLACGGLSLAMLPAAQAAITVLQPPKLLDGNKPLVLTLLFSEDDSGDSSDSNAPAHTYNVPDNIVVAASADMLTPVQLQLQRDPAGPAQMTLQRGEFRKVSYSASFPTYLRGVVRLETVGIDAAPVLVAVVRPRNGEAVASAPDVVESGGAAASASVITPGSSASPIGTAPTMDDLNSTARISFNEPMYIAAGNSGGHATAKFQLSFKFRLFQPDDMRSRGLIDNLYFGYTQYSIWDLQAPSAPFRDTNYRPSIYYSLPDLGIRNNVVSRMSIASGVEHESNGRDGTDSRGLNIYFVKPTFTFGDLNQTQLRISPKVYGYMGPLRDNPDIAQYRGHMDLNITVGKPDGVEFSTTLRKGTRSNYGSADSSLSYPVSRLLPGTAGYLMASFFYGYGESLLTYNQKLTPQLRIGYSLAR